MNANIGFSLSFSLTIFIFKQFFRVFLLIYHFILFLFIYILQITGKYTFLNSSFFFIKFIFIFRFSANIFLQLLFLLTETYTNTYYMVVKCLLSAFLYKWSLQYTTMKILYEYICKHFQNNKILYHFTWHLLLYGWIQSTHQQNLKKKFDDTTFFIIKKELYRKPKKDQNLELST